LADPILTAELSGKRAILLSWVYGANADFQVFWKSSSPSGQEYALLATTNAFSYTTADLDPSKTYFFYVRVNVGATYFYSNVVELFVSCGKGVILSVSPPIPPERQWFPLVQPTMEVYLHNYSVQSHQGDPDIDPIFLSIDSVFAETANVFSNLLSYQFTDGYSPVRVARYCNFNYFRFILNAPNGVYINNAFISLYVPATPTALPYEWDFEFTGANIDNAPVPAGYTTSGTAYMNVNNSRTTNKVTWRPVAPYTAGKQYYTPDLGPILTEIVARPGWVSGNYVGLIFWGKGMSGCNALYNQPYFGFYPPYGQPTELRWVGVSDGTPSKRPTLNCRYALPGA